MAIYTVYSETFFSVLCMCGRDAISYRQRINERLPFFATTVYILLHRLMLHNSRGY